MKKTRLFAVIAAVAIALCCVLVACNKQFTVTFETNGGSAVESVQVDKDGKVTKPTDPTKEGHDFVAWYKDEALTDEWIFDTDTVTGDITLYAKWEQKQSTDNGVDLTEYKGRYANKQDAEDILIIEESSITWSGHKVEIVGENTETWAEFGLTIHLDGAERYIDFYTDSKTGVHKFEIYDSSYEIEYNFVMVEEPTEETDVAI